MAATALHRLCRDCLRCACPAGAHRCPDCFAAWERARKPPELEQLGGELLEAAPMPALRLQLQPDLFGADPG